MAVFQIFIALTWACERVLATPWGFVPSIDLLSGICVQNLYGAFGADLRVLRMNFAIGIKDIGATLRL